MSSVRRGVLARLAAGGVAGATALAGITVGLAAPAHAAPVPVTTTLTDPAGNTLDGYVSIDQLQTDGTYDGVGSVYVADGMVSLPLEPGTYKLRFSDEDGLFVPEYYSDKATFDTADPVVVSGPTALAPVSLAARPLLTGVVVSPTGRPVENASVTLFDAATNTPRDYYSTNRAGAFAFGVEPGSYKVRVSAGGFATEFYNNKPTVETADPIAVGAGGASAGQIVLSEGSVVTGRVTSAAGAPLERARVVVWNAAGTSTEGADYTDANGVYRVEGVEPGTVKVQFTDPLDEYLDEWHADKTSAATADPVAVGVDTTVTLDASLAPDPSNVAPDPADVDLFGAVVDSAGRPVAGAVVAAYDTPTDGDRQQAAVQQTNRAGQYFFTGLDRSTENAYKVYAVDGFDVEEGAYARLPRWFGGAQSYAGAQVVGIPAAGVNISLPLTGGISGTVSSESGMSVRGVEVRFFDESGNPAATEYDTQAYAEEDGTYTDTSLTPGTYKVQFVDSYYDDSDPRAHAPEWYDNTTFAKAKVITVKSGQTVTGINAALNEQLRALRKPEIRGKQYLGGKLRAYPGVWSVDTGTTYAYEWLVDGAVVGTGSTYAVTKGDKNERITLRVLSQNRGLTGTALTSTQVIKKKPKVKVSVNGVRASVTVSAKKVKAKKFTGSVVAKKIVRTDEYGAPVYKKIGKAKLRNGRASLTLKKLTKGKNKVVFLITLKGGKYGNAEVTRTIKVRR